MYSQCVWCIFGWLFQQLFIALHDIHSAPLVLLRILPFVKSHVINERAVERLHPHSPTRYFSQHLVLPRIPPQVKSHGESNVWLIDSTLTPCLARVRI